MALPLLLLAGGMAAMNAGLTARREAGAERFRSGLGTRSSLEYPTDIYGGELEGPPIMQPGTGLLGATSDPQQAAFLELMGRMADAPGVRPQDLMTMAGRMVELGQTSKLQSESLGAAWDRMISGQGFQAQQNELERDFTWARTASDQDFRAEENRIEREARERARLGDYRHAFALVAYRDRLEAVRAAQKAPDVGSGRMIYPSPGGGGVIGPMSGTPEYAKGVTEVRDFGQSVERVDTLLESYMAGDQGREFMGREAGEQAGLYNALVADIAKAQAAGVLQPGELKRIQDAYPSPQEFFSKFYSGDEYLLGVMQRLRKDFSGKYETARQAHPWTRALPGIAPDLAPAPTRESVAKKILNPASSDVVKRLRPLSGARGIGNVYRAPGEAGDLSR